MCLGENIAQAISIPWKYGAISNPYDYETPLAQVLTTLAAYNYELASILSN